MAFNFATRPMLLSGSLAEARRNAVVLYRDFLKYVPVLIDDYNIDVNIDVAKIILRAEFEKNSLVRDPVVIDQLVFKGRNELEEIRNKWKQRTHIMKFFNQNVLLNEDDEIRRFVAGYEVDQLEGEEGLDEDKRDPIFPQFYPHQQQNTKVE